MGPRIGPHLFISEIRTIAADDLWMSPCYKQASVAIHFTWKQDWPGVSALLPVIERELAPIRARPHWGKLFTMSSASLASLYERLRRTDRSPPVTIPAASSATTPSTSTSSAPDPGGVNPVLARIDERRNDLDALYASVVTTRQPAVGTPPDDMTRVISRATAI